MHFVHVNFSLCFKSLGPWASLMDRWIQSKWAGTCCGWSGLQSPSRFRKGFGIREIAGPANAKVDSNELGAPMQSEKKSAYGRSRGGKQMFRSAISRWIFQFEVVFGFSVVSGALFLGMFRRWGGGAGCRNHPGHGRDFRVETAAC